MKTAICYYSRHHGNTLKVLKAMAEGTGIDLIDVTSRVAVHLEDYDCIGFASGIYYSEFQETVLNLPGSTCPKARMCSLSTPAAPCEGAIPRPSPRP